MKQLDINKIHRQQVLNFNFRTNMVFKCTKREYAEDLLNGKVFFNIPEKWIEIEEKSQKQGQGDSLEGTCLIADKDDKSQFISNLKLNEKFEYFEKHNKIYFRNKDIRKLYCFCMYGLNDNSFNERYEDRFGKVSYCSRIDKSYFSEFTDLKSVEEYLDSPKNEQPVVVFIFNPHSFFERIRKALIDYGFRKEEIIVSPVEYIDKNKTSVAMVPYPIELLLKDKYFQKQSEIRIIINSTNDKLLDKLKNNNQKINIGNIKDIATIYDYYFEDLILMKEGNEVLFNLPFPEVQAFEEMTLRELLGIFVQTSNDRLPEPMSVEKRKDIIDEIKGVIKQKYGFSLEVKDGTININGFSGDINQILDT